MRIKKLLPIMMMTLAPLSPKAQKAVQIIPEAGICGTVKTAPMMLGGVNVAYTKGNNLADAFVGGSLTKEGTPGFVGIVFDNYAWSKHFGSWVRDLFMASKNGVTSTLDVAPVKFNTSAGNFNFSIMPAYCRSDDFVSSTTGHSIKGIFQTLFSMTKKDKLALEMQYGTTPASNITDTRFGSFADGFNFTATYSRSF